MKRIITTFLAIVLVLTGALLDSWLRPVHAQTTTQVEFSYVAAHSSCVAATNTTVFCFAADTGIWISVNGATTFTQIGAAAAVGVQKVNGVAPGSTGNVTVSCPGTTSAATATVSNPPLSISSGDLAVGAPTVSVPALPVTTTCTATGS